MKLIDFLEFLPEGQNIRIVINGRSESITETTVGLVPYHLIKLDIIDICTPLSMAGYIDINLKGV